MQEDRDPPVGGAGRRSEPRREGPAGPIKIHEHATQQKHRAESALPQGQPAPHSPVGGLTQERLADMVRSMIKSIALAAKLCCASKKSRLKPLPQGQPAPHSPEEGRARSRRACGISHIHVGHAPRGDGGQRPPHKPKHRAEVTERRPDPPTRAASTAFPCRRPDPGAMADAVRPTSKSIAPRSRNVARTLLHGQPAPHSPVGGAPRGEGGQRPPHKPKHRAEGTERHPDPPTPYGSRAARGNGSGLRGVYRRPQCSRRAFFHKRSGQHFAVVDFVP